MSDNQQFAQANPDMRNGSKPKQQQLAKARPEEQARPHGVNPGFGIASGSDGEKPIPHDIEAERAVLGSILLNYDCVVDVAEILTPDDFWDIAHAEIFTTILDMLADGVGFDLVLVPNYLRKRGKLGKGEGQVQASYLLDLFRSTPTPYHVIHYTQVVFEKAFQRKIIKFSAYVTQLGFSQNFNSAKALEKMDEGISRLQAIYHKSKTITPGYLPHEKTPDFIFDLIKKQEDDIAANNAAREALASGDKSVAISKTYKGKIIYPAPLKLCFGIKAIDGGQRPAKSSGNTWGTQLETLSNRSLFERGAVATYLAPPGGGKTRYGRWLADMLASDEHIAAYVLYIHTELTKEQMQVRRIASLANISYSNLVLGNLDDAQQKRRLQVLDSVGNWHGRADYWHASNMRMDEIVKQVHVKDRALYSATGRHYDAVFLDYGHNLPSPKGILSSSPASEEAVRVNWQQFQALTNQLNVAGMIFGQMNRLSIRKGKPEMDAGFGGSAIEQYTNVLLATQLPDPENMPNLYNLWCLKNTFGPLGWCVQLEADEYYNIQEV